MTKSRPVESGHGIVGLSQKDIGRATLAMTAQHPVTLYAAAAGVLGVLASTVLGPSLALFGLTVGGISVGSGSWIVNYFFRNEHFARRYLEKIRTEMEKRKEQMLESVRRRLAGFADDVDAGEFARQGLGQITKVQEKFDNMQGLLASKLSVTELTYGRYFGTAEQVVLSVLDNLHDMADLLESVRTIDRDYLQSRMKSLKRQRGLSGADEQELATLETRAGLREGQLEKVNILLTKNEEAMTSLDRTTAAIAAMKTVAGRSTVDMETARQQLEELARRAQDYSLT